MSLLKAKVRAGVKEVDVTQETLKRFKACVAQLNDHRVDVDNKDIVN